MNTKTFSLRTILTVTTGRLLTKGKTERDNGIGDLYEILGWMSGEKGLFTHQLPRVGEECKPWLLKWFPKLAVYGVQSSLDSLDKWLNSCKKSGDYGVGIDMWLTEMKMMFPDVKDEYEVGKIPEENHKQINPMEELVAMVGDKQIITVLV